MKDIDNLLITDQDVWIPRKDLEKIKHTLLKVDTILKDAIDSIDKGEKINGLEYARKLISECSEL